MTAPYQFPHLFGPGYIDCRIDADEAVANVYQLSDGRTDYGLARPVNVRVPDYRFRGYRVRIKRRPFLVRVGVVLRRMFA